VVDCCDEGILWDSSRHIDVFYMPINKEVTL
jgi:hypothetical protein